MFDVKKEGVLGFVDLFGFVCFFPKLCVKNPLLGKVLDLFCSVPK